MKTLHDSHQTAAIRDTSSETHFTIPDERYWSLG
jgi:hypothetical protein